MARSKKSASICSGDSEVSLTPTQELPTNEEITINTEETAVVEGPDGGYGWVVVASSAFLIFATYGNLNASGVYLEAYKKEFPTNDVSVIGTTGLGCASFGGIFAGVVVKKLGRRITVTLGAALYVLGQLGASFFTSYIFIVLTHGILCGVGTALCFTSVTAPARYFTKRLGIATGIAVGGAGVGGMVMAPLASMVINAQGRQWALRYFAFASGIIMVISILLMRSGSKPTVTETESSSASEKIEETVVDEKFTSVIEEKSQILKSATTTTTGDDSGSETAVAASEEAPASIHPLDEAPPSARSVVFKLIRSLRFQIFFSWALFMSFGLLQPLLLVADYAIKHNISPMSAALLISLLNGSQTVGNIATGFISDRIGPLKTLIILMVCASVNTLVLWPLAVTYPPLVVFSIVHGFCMGGIGTLIPSITTGLFGLEAVTIASGAIYTSSSVGGLAGTPITNIINKATGKDLPGIFFGGTMLAIGGSIALGLWVKTRKSSVRNSIA